MTSHHPSSPRLGLIALACGASLALGACHAERIVADSYPTTYAERHPIMLAEGATRLDLPVGAGARGLTERQRDDIRAFAADWRKNGRGPVGMMAPAGGDYGVPAVRAALAASGVPATQIVSQRYRPEGQNEIGLVRLGYVKLKAEVAHPCGLWPDDMGKGSGDMYGASENREYWNFGCAAQQNLAAQVADPEDLVRPRAETPVYAGRRQTVIQRHRDGQDSATTYQQRGAVISTAVQE